MSITKDDVLSALLALDAYNRHRNDPNKRKMGEIDEGQLSETIGSATFKQSSDLAEQTQASLSGASLAGFSASEYTIAGGKMVISYRGTDFDFSSLAGFGELVKDIAAGWLQSFGITDATGTGLPGSGLSGPEAINYQPYYAIKFYELVSGGKLFPNDEEIAAIKTAQENVWEKGTLQDASLFL